MPRGTERIGNAAQTASTSDIPSVTYDAVTIGVRLKCATVKSKLVVNENRKRTADTAAIIIEAANITVDAKDFFISVCRAFEKGFLSFICSMYCTFLRGRKHDAFLYRLQTANVISGTGRCKTSGDEGVYI